MTTFKDGKAKAINFSYFSPYDVLQAPIQSALNKAAAQDLNPEETSDYILGLMFDPDNERFAGDIAGDIVDKRSKEIKNLTKVLEVLDKEQKKYLSDYLEAMRKIGSTTNGGRLPLQVNNLTFFKRELN